MGLSEEIQSKIEPEQLIHSRFVEIEMGRMFEERERDVTLDLICSAAKNIVQIYPANQQRNNAVLHLLYATEQLKKCLEAGQCEKP
jgi:succinylglutamate desuccinylase